MVPRPTESESPRNWLEKYCIGAQQIRTTESDLPADCTVSSSLRARRAWYCAPVTKKLVPSYVGRPGRKIWKGSWQIYPFLSISTTTAQVQAPSTLIRSGAIELYQSYSSHFVPHNLYLSAKRVILTTFNIRSLLPCLKSSEDPILLQGIRSNVLILAHVVLPECPLLASFTSPLSPEHLVPALFAHSSVGTLYLFFLPREFTPCALIAYGFLLPI